MYSSPKWNLGFPNQDVGNPTTYLSNGEKYYLSPEREKRAFKNKFLDLLQVPKIQWIAVNLLGRYIIIIRDDRKRDICPLNLPFEFLYDKVTLNSNIKFLAAMNQEINLVAYSSIGGSLGEQIAKPALLAGFSYFMGE